VVGEAKGMVVRTIGWVAYNPKRALMMEAYCYLLKEPAGERKLLFMEEAHNRLDYKIIKWKKRIIGWIIK